MKRIKNELMGRKGEVLDTKHSVH